MSQRFTLDRASFEQFLAAASLLQQFQRQASRQDDVQPFWALVDLQRALQSGKLGLDQAIQQVPQLACQLLGGNGAGVWLFGDGDEFIWRAGTGSYANDERLRLQVLSRLVAMEDEPSDWRAANRNWDAGYYPGCVKSLLVEPIRQGRNIAGALAAFGTEFDAFTERDASKLRLLAGVLGQALEQSTKAGLQQAVALERYAMRELIDRLVPGLQVLADNQAQDPHRSSGMAGEQSPDQTENAGREPRPHVSWRDIAHAQQQMLASANPSFSRDEHAFTDELNDGEQLEPLPNIYVPGIGVRAALGYDDEKQPSHFWFDVRQRFAQGASLVAAGLRNGFGTLAHAGRRVGAQVRRTAQYRPTLPSLPFETIRSRAQEIRANCRAAAGRAASKLRTATRQISLPDLPADAIQKKFASAERSAGRWSGKSLRAVGPAFRDAPKVLPDLPPIQLRRVDRRLKQAGAAVVRGTAYAGQRLRAQLSSWRPKPSSELRIDWRAARRTLPAVGIVLVMLAFLFSEPGLHRTLEVASASTARSAPAAAITPATKLAAAADPAAHAPDLTNSPTHKKITDPDVQSDLENMTRYEIGTVRRAAQYGDDLAAFQLGMAYETGYDVPQSCARAVQWVRSAAEAGNSAAQYNLGLRYRDGDGVTPDPQQAAAWLQKAAAQKYPSAHAALASLSSAAGH